MHGTLTKIHSLIERELISARRWHVVHVRTNQEAKVAKEVEKIGMGSYIPLEPKKRPYRGRHGMAYVPVFRGYIFAGFDPCGTLWGQLHDIDGYIRLLKYDGRPASICEAAMERIRQVEAMLMDYRVVIPMAVKVGAIVRFIDCPPWSGLFAPVIEVDHGNKRVKVRFGFAGGTAEPWLDEGNFEVV